MSMTPDPVLKVAMERGLQIDLMMKQVEQLNAERLRLTDLIVEFVNADFEIERHMTDCPEAERYTRTPVFDRYDAAVAALKEAVK